MKTDRNLEAEQRCVAEMAYLRLVDLPGFIEWSAQYRGLNQIIPNLNEYRLLVHPDELKGPMDRFFEKQFQTVLDDENHRGPRRRSLSEFKKVVYRTRTT